MNSIDKEQLKIAESRLPKNAEFLEACTKGQLEIIRSLLKSGADINCCDGRGLILACAFNHLEVVRYLLTSNEIENNADIDSIDYADALSAACLKSNIDIINYLLFSPELTKHAKINKIKTHDISEACMPFYMVCTSSNAPMIRSMIYEFNGIFNITKEDINHGFKAACLHEAQDNIHYLIKSHSDMLDESSIYEGIENLLSAPKKINIELVYYIFRYSKVKSINSSLDRHIDLDAIKQINQILSLKKLHDKLENNIALENDSNRKSKI